MGDFRGFFSCTPDKCHAFIFWTANFLCKKSISYWFLSLISLNPQLIRNLLGKLSAHIVVALIALIAIGGATRVMEAGLACPDWPLCYGSFFPKGKMNLQVFLEWFHRLDAFFVGIAIFLQLILSFIYKF